VYYTDEMGRDVLLNGIADVDIRREALNADSMQMKQRDCTKHQFQLIYEITSHLRRTLREKTNLFPHKQIGKKQLNTQIARCSTATLARNSNQIQMQRLQQKCSIQSADAEDSNDTPSTPFEEIFADYFDCA